MLFPIVLLAGYGILFLVMNKKVPMFIKEADHKKHPFYIFYPISYFFYSILFAQIERSEEKNKERLRLLHVCAEKELDEMQVLFRIKQITWVLFCIFIAVSIGTLSLIGQNKNQKELLLERNTYGKGEVTKNLVLHGEEVETYPFVIQEQVYTAQQLKEKMKEASDYVSKHITGKNKSLNEVRLPLDFTTKLSDNAVRISYYPKHTEIIDSSGFVQNEEVEEAGFLTQITVRFTYREEQQEDTYSLLVLPPQLTASQKASRKIKQILEKLELSDRSAKVVRVPAALEGVSISMKEEKDSKPYLIGFIVAAGILLCFREEENLKQEVKQRDRQLMIDYPTLINKLVLLLGAGMTLKGSIIQITDDYQHSLKQGGKKRYLQEELLASVHELEAGVPEPKVYQNLGKRLRLTPYCKLTTLMVQNLTKGASNLLVMLEQEESTAFETRKEMARRMGEEAGTKLLIPMMILLMVVLMLIMYPAIVNFRI